MEILIPYLLRVFKAALSAHTETTQLIDFVFLNATTHNMDLGRELGSVLINAHLGLGENPIQCHVQLLHINA